MEDVQADSMPEQKSHGGTLEVTAESEYIENATTGKDDSSRDVETGIPDLSPTNNDPDNPLNWPQWRKDLNLAMISFHAMMTNFVGAGIIPVYSTFAEKFGVSIQDVSYFTSIHILFTGLAPVFLLPLSRRFGRRPVWLISTFCAAVCNVGCAKSNSYSAMLACRVVGSIFLSPPIALGPPVVVEMYPEHQRGYKTGIWTVLVSLGPPVGPFIMGFVAQRAGWEWIYWIFAIVSAVQFVLYLFFSPETRYLSPSTQKPSPTSSTDIAISSRTKKYLPFRRIDPTPWTLAEMIQPFLMAKHIRILLAICCHTMIFNLSAALLTVEIPQLFAARFGFNSEQIGLQFLGIIVGTILGEVFNAVAHRLLKARSVQKGQSTVKLDKYLQVSYIGFVCMSVGLVIFCVLLGQTAPMQYNVRPIIGIGIAGFGNQVVANFLVNYVIQLHSEQAGLTSVLLGVIRQTWCFIGPFWFPDMFDTLGFNGTAGLLVGLVAISVVPLVWMQWRY